MHGAPLIKEVYELPADKKFCLSELQHQRESILKECAKMLQEASSLWSKMAELVEKRIIKRS